MAAVPSRHLSGASPPPTMGLPPLPPAAQSPSPSQRPNQTQSQTQSKPLPAQPQPSASRYRALRGKSISRPRVRDFEVYSDSEEANGRHALRTQAQQDSPSVRRRSRSVTAAVGALQLDGDLPTASASPLSPRSSNLPGPSTDADVAGPPTDPDDGHHHPADPEKPLPLPLPLPGRPRAAFRSVSHNSPFGSKTAAVSVANLAGHHPPSQQEQPHVPGPVRDSVLYADEVARLEAETDRILAEQKKLDLARLQAQIAAATTPPRNKKRQQILGKLGLLGRHRWSPAGSARPGSPGSPSSGHQPSTPLSAREYRSLGSASSRGPRTPASAGLARPRTAPGDAGSDTDGSPSPGSPAEMSMIRPGGKGIVPQTDAPTSASNAGERRVTVQCLSSTINLPVTNDTTPTDLVFSSANFTTHQIDPASCVVVECYTTLGLERRLRKYERVRDVMNSWDRDQQNSLMILPLESADESVANLQVSAVKRGAQAPPGFLVHIYHSSRPGKWNKRWVTLSESGQMFACKKPDGKATDKDSVSLCHLSDFDIYTPRESTLRRSLKPPKRFCYAIKSQQKTIVFSSNTENFVHFFAADDAELAGHFYDAVHAWRSWYLVNKQVDLQGKNRGPTSPGTQNGRLGRSGTERPRTQSQRSGGDGGDGGDGGLPEGPLYTIGDFKPLMDMQHFDEPLEDFGKTLEQEAKAVQERVRAEQKQAAERQREKALQEANQARAAPPLVSAKAPEEFAAGGLLGDGYDKRKASNGSSAAPGCTSPSDADGPFTNGDSLLAQAAKAASPPAKTQEGRSWFPSATEHTARERSQSRPSTASRPSTSSGGPSQPLVDLQRDPRPRRPGPRSGQGVRTPTGAPLVNYATGHHGPPQHKFANAGPPPRGVHRSYTAGPGGMPDSGSSGSVGSAARMGPSGHPSLPSGNRPRAKSSASQPGGQRRKGPLLEDVGAPPVPSLPHRSARREMPRGRHGAPGGPTEPLVNLAK